MKTLNLALAFLLEIALLVALGFWGFHLGNSNMWHWIVGIGAPSLTAVVWGQVAAPMAKNRLKSTQLLVFKVVLFTLGALALYAVGQKRWALGFEGVSLISLVLGFMWKQ